MHISLKPRVSRFARFTARQDGATLMEYALITALLSVIVAIAVMAVMGSRT